MSWTIYVISAFVICVIATFLIVHNEYEDGLVGRISLALMAISTSMIVAEAVIEQTPYHIRPANVTLFLGMAMFLARHVYRFIRWRVCGDYNWRKAVK